MTATETTNLSDLLTANEQQKRLDGLRRYRTRLRDAAGDGELDVKHAAKLAEAAADAGVEEGKIERHISAVRTHAKNTARLKELETEVPAAEVKRKTLIDELRKLNDQANDVRVAIGESYRPGRERSLLTDSIRRIESKHANAGIFAPEASS